MRLAIRAFRLGTVGWPNAGCSCPSDECASGFPNWGRERAVCWKIRVWPSIKAQDGIVTPATFAVKGRVGALNLSGRVTAQEYVFTFLPCACWSDSPTRPVTLTRQSFAVMMTLYASSAWSLGAAAL